MSTRFIVFDMEVFRRGMLCFLSVIFVLSIPQASRANEPLPHISLQSALLFALDESTKIKIAGEREQQALHSVEEARSEYLPDIKLLVETGIEFKNPASFSVPEPDGSTAATENVYDVSLTLRQMLFDDTKVAEVMRREKLGEAKSIETKIIEQDVIEDTVEAYIAVLSAQKNAYAAAEMLVLVRELVDKVGLSYEAGGESKVKYDFARARLALAESKYTKAVSSYKDANSRLEALTGRLPKFLAIEPEELSIQDYDMNFYKYLARKKNSELELINSNITATEIDYKRQKATYMPKVNLLLEAGQSHDKGGEVGRARDASALIQIELDIFKGFERRAAKDRIASKIRELEYEKEDLIKEITKNVKVNYNEIEGLKASAYNKVQEVDSYMSLRRIEILAAEQGEIDLFQSIENEENIYDSISQIYKIQSDIYTKSYSLLKLIGSLKKEKFCESC